MILNLVNGLYEQSMCYANGLGTSSRQMVSELVRFAAFIYKFKVRTDKFLKTDNFLSFW
jgi:hypothetical protein